MAGIQARDTRPEMVVRKFLHRQGFRYRLHSPKLQGRPDLVLPRYQLCIFVHGCFWHRHLGCKYATVPRTREEFWRLKFAQTVERDSRTRAALLAQGWRVFEIWECGTRRPDPDLAWLIDAIPDYTQKHISWPPTDAAA